MNRSHATILLLTALFGGASTTNAQNVQKRENVRNSINHTQTNLREARFYYEANEEKNYADFLYNGKVILSFSGTAINQEPVREAMTDYIVHGTTPALLNTYFDPKAGSIFISMWDENDIHIFGLAKDNELRLLRLPESSAEENIFAQLKTEAILNFLSHIMDKRMPELISSKTNIDLQLNDFR